MDYNLRILLGGGIIIWIVPLILIGIILFSIYKILTVKDIDSNALTILKERYSNGELSSEEYKQMKKVLTK